MGLGRVAQAWSLEVIVSVTIFIVFFIFIVTFISFNSKDPIRELQSETLSLSTIFTHDNYFSIISRGKLQKSQFSKLAEMNYTDLKRSLRIKNDFCIFIQDADGNLIPVTYDGKSYSGIGNGSSITVGGVACGQ